jgi:hypothetical protein
MEINLNKMQQMYVYYDCLNYSNKENDTYN